MESDHPVFDSDAMDEGLLVVQEVGVGHPQLIGHPVIQGQVVGDLGVGQPFVPPRLLEVHGQGVVLQRDGEARGGGLQLVLEIRHIVFFFLIVSLFFSFWRVQGQGQAFHQKHEHTQKAERHRGDLKLIFFGGGGF